MYGNNLELVLEISAELIRNGGVVAFPTETVYGLGANAYDGKAVARIYEIKKRPSFDPLIVHICHPDDIKSIASEIPLLTCELIERFFPGPLTIVVPKNSDIPDIVTAGLPTVAVRMPAHPLALELIRLANVPVAAPSANLFGRASPTTAEHVRKQLGTNVDVVIDGGACFVGIESTIISLVSTPPTLLRTGGIPVEEIEKVVGEVVIASAKSSELPSAPGQLPYHYAPRTPLILYESMRELPRSIRAGLLVFQTPREIDRFEVVEVLSPSGDLREAGVNFFSALHRLDEMGLDVIVAEKVPERGIGAAINDRLIRASRAFHERWDK
jgi:L-threonylcarbamoyladenylate synthase